MLKQVNEIISDQITEQKNSLVEVIKSRDMQHGRGDLELPERTELVRHLCSLMLKSYTSLFLLEED